MVKDISIDSGLRALLDSGGKAGKSSGQADGANFGDMLKDTMAEVNNLQKEAEASSVELLKGDLSIHDTMISLEKADLSFKFMMKARSKILDAYQTVMRMPV